MVKIKMLTVTHTTVPRILRFCGCTPPLPQWVAYSRCTVTILSKTHYTSVYKDLKLTEWSVVFTDMLTQKLLRKMLSNRFYLSFCPK